MMLVLTEIVNQACKEYETMDIIGHSMGALFAICWGIENKHKKVKSIVAMNPGFADVSYLEEKIVRVMGLTPIRYGHSMITHSLEWTDDVQVVEKRFQDPLELKYIQDCILTPLLDAKTYVLKYFQEQNIPVCIIWSNKDPVIDTNAVKTLLTHKLYKNAFETSVPFHELCTTKAVGGEVCTKTIGAEQSPRKKAVIHIENNDDIDLIYDVSWVQALLGGTVSLLGFYTVFNYNLI